jgi:hypothetical protein
MDESFIKLIVIAFASVGSTALSIYFIGLTATERVIVTAKIKELKNKFFKV